MKYLIVMLAIIALSLGGCVGAENDPDVVVIVHDRGIAANSEVQISNYYPGATVDVTYRVWNVTDKAITPELFYIPTARIADYSQANGAVAVPNQITAWLKLPPKSALAAGEYADMVVTLEIPKKEVAPPKFGFQIGVANTDNAKLQTAIGTWWLVSLR